MSVLISNITEGSPAQKKSIKKGDTLVSINGNEIMDVLDYRFYENEEKLSLEIINSKGKKKKIKIRKEEYEELGLEFEDYLMDSQKSCKNKCIFCFIDQLPKNMRKSLYFKDDDSRLSFLFGNYITLTGLSEHEISRIIKMHISPVNISVHTTNPDLRCRMMKNPFAGESLKIIERFNKAGITMNCQLVLCPDYNDGKELERTLTDLYYYENVRSVAAVPVGLTKYRENLTDIKPYDKDSAGKVIDTIEEFAKMYSVKYGERKVYASDEFYLTAKREIPSKEFYGEFSQLDNGVGMWALFKSESSEAISLSEDKYDGKKRTIVTGVAAFDLLSEIVLKAKEKWYNLDCQVIKIKNNFFGERITVAGLLTGKDIIEQLKGKDLGEEILLPKVMLKYGENVFLDDTSLADLEKELNVKAVMVDIDGYCFIDKLIGV